MAIKVKSIMLDNFAAFNHVKINIDENITYLIGPNGAGKTTLGLNAIWFALKGIAEKGSDVLIGERYRFIGENGPSATATIVFHDTKLGENITVTRRLTKTGHTVKFIAPEGISLDQSWLNDIFNVFLISPNRFINLSPKEQSLALGIDTSEYDEKKKDLKEEYTLINQTIRNIGELKEVSPVEQVDTSAIIKQHNELSQKIASKEKDEEKLHLVQSEIIELREKLKKLEKEQLEIIINLNAYPENMDVELAGLMAKIENASAINQKYIQYQGYLREKKALDDASAKLLANKTAQKLVDVDKIKYLQSFNFPLTGLSVNDDGELLLNEKPIKEPYFSTGELLKIVPMIMAASSKSPLKYVFIQHFNLLDNENQKNIIEHLVANRFQVVVEMVDEQEKKGYNSIILKEQQITNNNTDNEQDQIHSENI